LPYQNWEWQLASGFVCGFIGYSLMSYASKVIKEKEEKKENILSIWSEVETSSLPKSPSKKAKPKSKKRKK
jgi:hypothetical protein